MRDSYHTSFSIRIDECPGSYIPQATGRCFTFRTRARQAFSFLWPKSHFEHPTEIRANGAIDEKRGNGRPFADAWCFKGNLVQPEAEGGDKNTFNAM